MGLRVSRLGNRYFLSALQFWKIARIGFLLLFGIVSLVNYATFIIQLAAFGYDVLDGWAFTILPILFNGGALFFIGKKASSVTVKSTQ